MTVRSGFFNSVDNDRVYSAEDFGSVFDGMMTDGVYQSWGAQFSVTPGLGSSVDVGTGRGWFLGTWVVNDEVLSVSLPDSHTTFPRYDVVVLDIDKSVSVRSTAIKVVSGTASQLPTVPPLIDAENHKQRPLAYIFRSPGLSTVAPANINYLVGTSFCPYSKSVLATTVDFYTSMHQAMGEVAHRQFWRGKNHGTVFTAAQKTAIANGSFDDLWVGDYWTIGGKVWRVMDVNPWKGIGGKEGSVFNTNHLIVMPDTNLYTARMHTSASTTSGYGGSNMYVGGLTTALSTIKGAFGSSNILKPPQSIDVERDSSAVCRWEDTKTPEVSLPQEIHVFGSFIMAADGNRPGNSDGDMPVIHHQQLAAFRLNPQLVGHNWWLRDAYNNSSYCLVFNGRPDKDSANVTTHGVRPMFAVG